MGNRKHRSRIDSANAKRPNLPIGSGGKAPSVEDGASESVQQSERDVHKEIMPSNHHVPHAPWNRREKLQVLFDGMLVIFTFVLALVSIAQWAVTRESMQVSTRAYLAMAQIKVFCPICDTGQIPPPMSSNENNAALNIFFVNSGHSPASDITENVMLYVAPMEDNFDFTEMPDRLSQPKHISIQPSTEFPLQISQGTRAENIIDARGATPRPNGSRSTGNLYVYGHVSYTDAFHHRHTLLYCSQYHPPSNIGVESWSSCPHHNIEYDGDYNPSLNGTID